MSIATLTLVPTLIRFHRKTIRSRRRRLTPGDQALLTLAYPHQGQRLRTLTAGFGIAEATAWRRARETIGLLAAKATGPREALRRAKRHGWAFVILDSTPIQPSAIGSTGPAPPASTDRMG